MWVENRLTPRIDNQILGVKCLLCINEFLNRYPERVLSAVWKSQKFENFICKYFSREGKDYSWKCMSLFMEASCIVLRGARLHEELVIIWTIIRKWNKMLTIYNTNYWEIIIYIIIIHIMNILQVRLITVTHSMCVHCGFWWSLLFCEQPWTPFYDRNNIDGKVSSNWQRSPETTSNTQAMSKFDQFNV